MSTRRRIVIRRRRRPEASHMKSLKTNLSEVTRLMEIHGQLSGESPGRRRNVQVLNKSAIVMLLACWEAFIEDLAKEAFEQMLKEAESPTVFPDYVLAIAGKKVTKEGSLDVWKLANEGWKASLQNHKSEILKKYIEKGSFNTPSPENIDKLFSELIGLTSISSHWFWPGMSTDRAKCKLKELIELRGQIAHRVESSNPVYKIHVDEYRKFILRLSVIVNNRTLALIRSRTGKIPWRFYRHKKTR